MSRLLRIVFISLAFFVSAVQAQTLNTMNFEDQWEQKLTLDEQTKWLVVSQSKDQGNMVKEAFDSLSLKDLQQHGLLYIADISAMPSFVTKLFALPKMKEYPFKIALIREEGALAKMQLPLSEKEAVAVIALEQLKVGSVQYFSEKAELEAFLKASVIK